MASLQTFESTLKEVVQAKRLSASKMAKLTEIALKSMENDTQLVSILYRTHKSLQPVGKISSLYAFDALSRAARSQVNKQGLIGDINSEHGNCATFLLKIEGVLDGLFQDMVSLELPESKEKTKKILDIWVKSNTFPSVVLARLTKLLKGSGGKESDNIATPTTADPRQQSTPPITTPPQASTSTSQPPSAPVADVQSTLLALLNQAANAMAASSNGQTAANIAPPALMPAPQLDANQLALFQQLAKTAQSGSAVPTQPIPLPLSLVPSSASANAVPPVAPPVGGPSQPLPPYRDDRYGAGRRESQYDSFDGPERGRDRDRFHDDRRDHRGDFRGGFRGSFRGRGRGRWDDRDHFRDRSKDRTWGSPPRERRSRSRSPRGSRYGAGRRDLQKPYSPPRRPSTSHVANPPPPPHSGGASAADKDEFGRDIRAQSSESSNPASEPTYAQGLQPIPMMVDTPSASSTERSSTVPPEATQSPVASSMPSAIPSAPASTSSVLQGLDQFDISTFDPTSPPSWEALGRAWMVTNGYMPSQDELMQYVISGGSMGIYPTGVQYGEQWQGQGQRGRGQHEGYRGRGTGRGRGGHGYGDSRNQQGQWGRGPQQETDALTLGGGEESGGHRPAYGYQPGWQGSGTEGRENGPLAGDSTSNAPGLSSGAVGNAGKMQRVGDRWVFVRAEATASEVA